MATVSRVIDATPDEVFAVLANGWTYSNWVTGTSYMRAVDARWPEVGSRLHHASGVWPLVLRDETQVETIEPDRMLRILARGRPLGEARVLIQLAAEADGTRVEMTETPNAGPGKW